MNFAWRIYRRLAQAFPHEFKLAYGADVMQLGEDVIAEIAKRHGAAGLIRLLADIAIRVPAEYLSEMRRDLRYAWRGLIKSPGFALVGILSIGLAIGLAQPARRCCDWYCAKARPWSAPEPFSDFWAPSRWQRCFRHLRACLSTRLGLAPTIPACSSARLCCCQRSPCWPVTSPLAGRPGLIPLRPCAKSSAPSSRRRSPGVHIRGLATRSMVYLQSRGRGGLGKWWKRRASKA